jgi:penicillin-binding protein-related factor A (putative recombinase)
MLEKDLQARVLKRLRQGGGQWLNMHGGAFQTPGISDIVGCYYGYFVAIELKKPGLGGIVGDHLTPAQRNFLQQIKDNGGITFVANDEGELFEEFNQWRYGLSHDPSRAI